MATLLLHPCPPGPSKGILLNPSPGGSPAYHPSSLPALIPSNSSLSSSASSLAPGDSSDYFSKSASSSPAQSHSLPPNNHAHLHAHAKPRKDSQPSAARRIRFAPLPEPRRDDDTLDPVFLDDDDFEQPLTMQSALEIAGVALASPTDPDLSKQAYSLTSSPGALRKCLPTESLLLGCPRDECPCPGPSSEPDAQHTADCPHEWDLVRSPSPIHPRSTFAPGSPRKETKWSRVLAPLLGRSTRSHSSPLAMFSAEDVSTLNGDAHRGRRNSNNSGHGHRTGSSRESSVSHDRNGPDFGAPLNRWTSEGGPGAGLPLSTKKRLSLFGGGGGGVPLGRTQSLTSLSGKDEKKGRSVAAVPPRAGARRQTRMLNGRVYGAKRNPNAKNPFANVRTDEPEFVEWGYGGMGSVKNTAGQSSVWSRVQADNNAAGIARKAAEDEDDGTGMAWVRRRKEERERAKREAEERAKKEQEEREANAENADVEMNTESEATDTKEIDTEAEAKAEAEAKVAAPTVTVERSEKAEEAESAPMSPSATVPSTPAPTTPLASDGQKSPGQVQHITQAINIPASHRHHHSHSHSSSHTGHQHHSHTLSLSRIDTRESGETVRPLASPLKSSLPPPKHESAERASVSSSGASTASEDGEDGDSEDSPKDGGFVHDEDSEEEDEGHERGRLTALSAGVEKIARHHKEEQSSTAVGTPAEASS